jgi:hypothetical protein
MQGEEVRNRKGERIEVKRLKAGKLSKDKEERGTGRGRDYKKRLKSGQLCKKKERARNRKGERIL